MTAPDCPSCGLVARRSDLYDSGWGCPDGCGEILPRCACGRYARGYGAVTTEATGAVVHYCRQCSLEHCELDRYLRENPRRS